MHLEWLRAQLHTHSQWWNSKQSVKTSTLFSILETSPTQSHCYRSISTVKLYTHKAWSTHKSGTWPEYKLAAILWHMVINISDQEMKPREIFILFSQMLQPQYNRTVCILGEGLFFFNCRHSPPSFPSTWLGLQTLVTKIGIYDVSQN